MTVSMDMKALEQTMTQIMAATDLPFQRTTLTSWLLL